MHDEPSIITRWQNIAAANRVPLHVSLEITHQCNLNCSHCYLESAQTPPILRFEHWKSILMQLRKAGTLYITFLGGEAILHPDFLAISCLATELGFHASLITNGTLLNSRTFLTEIKKTGLKHITFSLLSLDAALHDKHTNHKGSWVKTMRAIFMTEQLGISIGINLLLTKYNIYEYFKFSSWCSKKQYPLNADALMTCKITGSCSNTPLRATPEQLKWFYEEQFKIKRPPQISKESPSLSTPICNFAQSKAAISPEGNLLPCIEIRQPLGNLVTEKFEDIWTNELANQWRSCTCQNLLNINPDLIPFCDLCPGMNLNESKSAFIVPQYVLEAAVIKKNAYEQYQ